MPESERPYEKFMNYGVSMLTDADLLAIILKSGTRDLTSTELAGKILTGGKGNLLNLYDLSYEDLLKFEGIGPVKAIQLKAVAELSIRMASAARKSDITLSDSSSVADYYMEKLRHCDKEQVVCAFFDVKSNLIGEETIFTGSFNRCMISPKEIFDRILDRHASCFILLHNHPSGDPTPSQDDISITSQIYQGALILGLTFIDHIIIGDHCFYSFHDEDMLR